MRSNSKWNGAKLSLMRTLSLRHSAFPRDLGTMHRASSLDSANKSRNLGVIEIQIKKFINLVPFSSKGVSEKPMLLSLCCTLSHNKGKSLVSYRHKIFQIYSDCLSNIESTIARNIGMIIAQTFLSRYAVIYMYQRMVTM